MVLELGLRILKVWAECLPRLFSEPIIPAMAHPSTMPSVRSERGLRGHVRRPEQPPLLPQLGAPVARSAEDLHEVAVQLVRREPRVPQRRPRRLAPSRAPLPVLVDARPATGVVPMGATVASRQPEGVQAAVTLPSRDRKAAHRP